MANISIWPGSSSFFPGNTPFGFYDYDLQFQSEADKVALWCSRRLGYPIVDVELQDINFYAAFEEAVTTYANELYAFRIRDNYLTLEGAPTSSTLNNALITPNLANVIKISEQYGAEAGVGGNVTWYSASITLTPGIQDYDLNVWASASLGISGSNLEIKRVFYEAPPAIVRYFDPYAGTGTGMMQLLDSFGFGGYSPAINFLMMPVNYDIGKLQAIEFNDQIRRSNYTFELINNRLKLFPIPDGGMQKLWLQYIKKSDRNSPYATGASGSNLITNVSQIPYTNPTYSGINSIGRQWIFEYGLALVKEILGYVRGKYSSIPIPNAEVTLNQSDLISAATSEKQALIERLRAYFDGNSRQSLLERKAAEAESLQKELNYVPWTIFIG